MSYTVHVILMSFQTIYILLTMVEESSCYTRCNIQSLTTRVSGHHRLGSSRLSLKSPRDRAREVRAALDLVTSRLGLCRDGLDPSLQPSALMRFMDALVSPVLES
jgi:hypothetical protein